MSITVENKKNGKTLCFPLMPDQIQVATAGRFIRYNLLSGSAAFPNGSELTGVSFSGVLYSSKRQFAIAGAPVEPAQAQRFLDECVQLGPLLRLTIGGTPIDMDAYLENYSIGYEGGFGDYTYKVSFQAAREVAVRVVKTATEPDTPEGEQDGRTYTVKRGDSLWRIAQKFYGSGSKWRKIFNANRKKIKNPRLIFPGQKLVIPK